MLQCVRAQLGFLCPVLLPQHEKDFDKLDRAQKAWGVRRDWGAAMVLCPPKEKLRVGRGRLVTVFCCLMGGFEKSGARVFSDTHNKRIKDNRQIARREIPIKC